MDKITFLNPHFFWLLLVIPLVLYWHLFSFKKNSVSLTISNTKSFKTKETIWTKIKPMLFYTKLVSLVFIIIALARPRSVDVSIKQQNKNGIDIVMAIDVSSSMLAQDLKPNRLEALKKVAKQFANNRTNDRMEIVDYAAESYTKTPITSDALIIQEAINSIQYENGIINDGTGIGIGLATAINRIKDSKAKSRIIILLTDGVNNAGTIDPIMAADIAKKYGIKIYTIAIGTNGRALFPYAKSINGEIVFQMMDVKIDESTLKQIAQKTDGKHFRATDNSKLKSIYDEIDKLEKSEIKTKTYTNYNELFRPFAIIALVLLVIEIILKNTILRGFI